MRFDTLSALVLAAAVTASPVSPAGPAPGVSLLGSGLLASIADMPSGSPNAASAARVPGRGFAAQEPPAAAYAPSGIRVERNQRMLEMVVKGDPARNGDSAMRALLRHFFRGAGEAEKNAPVRPRVRWLRRSPSLPRSEWIAAYAVPVSRSFPPPRGATLTDWAYGLIAETAYAGPYANAQPAIDSLEAEIRRRGLGLNGSLEEEFVRGRAPCTIRSERASAPSPSSAAAPCFHPKASCGPLGGPGLALHYA
jgi:hypothetical protein